MLVCLQNKCIVSLRLWGVYVYMNAIQSDDRLIAQFCISFSSLKLMNMSRCFNHLVQFRSFSCSEHWLIWTTFNSSEKGQIEAENHS